MNARILLLKQHNNPNNFDDEDRLVYIVKKVTNSMHPAVNECLTKSEVHGYCESHDWTVVIS